MVRDSRRAGRAGALALLTFLGVGAGGCAHQMGKGAAKGALENMAAQQAAASEEQQITRIAAQRAMAGIMAYLDEPEQRERMKRLVSEAVQQAVTTALQTATAELQAPAAGAAGVAARERGPAATLAGQLAQAATDEAIRRLAIELGPRGRLRDSVAGTSGDVSEAVVGNALAEIFPGCGQGPDAVACRQHRMQDLARTTGASLFAGVRQSISGWPFLLMAILLGVAGGALLHWTWSTLRLRRQRALREA